MSDIDDLLDSTLDDLADLPSFEPFPPGIHRALVSLEVKKINDSDAIEMKMKGVETIELTNPTSDKSIEQGDECNTLFMLGNDIGRGKFKAVAAVFGEAFSLSNLREIIEQVDNIECLITNSVRKDKDDPDKRYMNIKKVEVV